jgi:hypothetical protein
MTGTSLGAGGRELSGLPVPADAETAQIDRLIDLLLALEPFEVKHSAAASDHVAGAEAADDEAAGAAKPEQEALTEQQALTGPDAGAGPDAAAAPEARVDDAGGVPQAAKASADSTRAMLARMRAVLDREAARLGGDGLEGKAAVDQVALIARTLEKIDQMERLIAEDQARARSQTLSPEEREQMRQTVRQLILSAAERMAAGRTHDPHHEDQQRIASRQQDGPNAASCPKAAGR